MHVYRYHSKINQVMDGDEQLAADFASDDILDSEDLVERDARSSKYTQCNRNEKCRIYS